MANQSYHTTIIKLHIVYDGHFYFYDRHENGQLIIDAQRIDAERTTNIIKLNEEDPAVEISTRGKVEIGNPKGWSWMGTITAQHKVMEP